MTDPTMDDAEEEALFARLKRGLELVRRDASLAQADGAVVPPGPDPELTAALARVEASLRTLASNVEALARRADSVDAAIEARVEATVARTAAGLRAEVERLSSAFAALSARAEAARPLARPASERTSVAPPPRRGFGIGRAVLAVFVALVLIVLGITAATRLGYGLDELPISRNLQERLSAWRSAWLPQQLAPAAEQADMATPLAPSDAAPKPSVTADAAQAPSANLPATTPAAAPPAPSTPTAATPAAAAPASPPRAHADSPPTLDPSVPSTAVAPATPPAEPTAPPAPAAPAQDNTQATPPATSPAAPPLAARASGLTLRAKAPVWVEVRERKGRILLRRTLQAGETWSAPPDAEADLLLSAGNVHNLELRVNGASQPLPPSKGGVLRDAKIDNGA